MSTDKPESNVPVAADEGAFSLVQREAAALSKSSLVPKAYQGGKPEAIANCMIAMQVAKQVDASVLMVMQNLHVIQGKPSWSSTFIISAINSCKRFGPLKFKKVGKGMEASCLAYATEKDSGETLEGPTVSMEMAKAEGWLDKNGSKWKTMPELMLMYRAASFFGRLYAPEVLNGMHTVDEVADMDVVDLSGDDVTFEDMVQEAPEETVEPPSEQPQEVAGYTDSPKKAEQAPLPSEQPPAAKESPLKLTIQQKLLQKLLIYSGMDGPYFARLIIKVTKTTGGHSLLDVNAILSCSDGRAGKAIGELEKLDPNEFGPGQMPSGCPQATGTCQFCDSSKDGLPQCTTGDKFIPCPFAIGTGG